MFASSVVAALVALPFFAQSSYAQVCSRSYTVQAGDICDGISAANNVSTYQLAVVNPNTINTDCSNLLPGESICLGYQGSDCTNTHVVQLNEDCDSVASTYGLNTTVLYENNPQIDAACDNLYVGEVLCVAPDVEVPVASAGGSSIAVPTSVPATATLAIPTATVSATPDPTSAPIPSSTASAAEPSATDSGDDGDDGDDDDLPWCDEL